MVNQINWQEMVDSYNQANGTSLSEKQFLKTLYWSYRSIIITAKQLLIAHNTLMRRMDYWGIKRQQRGGRSHNYKQDLNKIDFEGRTAKDISAESGYKVAWVYQKARERGYRPKEGVFKCLPLQRPMGKK